MNIERKTLEKEDKKVLTSLAGLDYYFVRQAGCIEFECSDFMDEQYPTCRHSWDFAVCPMVKLLFRINRIAEKARGK